MKKFVISLFLILGIFLGSVFIPFCGNQSGRVYADEIKNIDVHTNNSVVGFNLRKSGQKIDKTLIQKLKFMGFDEKTICMYCFDNFNSKLALLKEKTDIEPINSGFKTINGMLEITKEIDGQSLMEESLFTALIEGVVDGKNDIIPKLKPERATIKREDNEKISNLRSAFETPITGTNQQGRINNIGVALKQFDGMIVAPNETVSFNKIIGDTTKEKGYSLAKIIVNGKYEDDFGGGVCQAATTLYNALLLADVEVLSAKPHSLKVGYVWGGFDAMVSNGLSDLVFKNTTGDSIVISTFCNNLECGVRIYGLKNDYLIQRISEKVDFDSEKQPTISSKYISKLEYYKDGELVKTKKLRTSSYHKLKQINE